MIRPILLSTLLLGSVACSASTTETQGGDFSGLVSGTSFGMCAGYCRTELRIDSTAVTFIETSQVHGQLPPRTQTLVLTSAEWQRIRRAVDAAALTRMAGVHGCPDCADGGAEWIEIRTADATVRVTFEYGRVLDPISALQTEIRALRERF
jgi:hypothetical protein